MELRDLCQITLSKNVALALFKLGTAGVATVVKGFNSCKSILGIFRMRSTEELQV